MRSQIPFSFPVSLSLGIAHFIHPHNNANFLRSNLHLMLLVC